ncbi:hypothetical protein H5410_014461 [Solanum commersonii]|uniref:Uncharacterized protein n=1 Tax=Solanum commersonii TaxID=4109 RepID=A0A9J5ZQZ2_SOLCO|nr:hypothetical protein H5410_014461 [Solanum commersonii]
MSPNDFGDSSFVCLIAVSSLPSVPSCSGPLGGIVLLCETIWRSTDCSFHRLFYPSPSGLCVLEQRMNATQDSIMNIHNKIQITYAQINCVLKDSSCDTPLTEILVLAILATCESSSSTKSI